MSGASKFGANNDSAEPEIMKAPGCIGQAIFEPSCVPPFFISRQFASLMPPMGRRSGAGQSVDCLGAGFGLFQFFASIWNQTHLPMLLACQTNKSVPIKACSEYAFSSAGFTITVATIPLWICALTRKHLSGYTTASKRQCNG